MTKPTNALTRRTLLALAAAATAAACGGKRAATPHGRASTHTGRAVTSPTAAPATAPQRTTTPTHGGRPGRRGPAREIAHGSRRQGDVALTFHTAGDPAIVNAVLRAARQAHAGLTMFVVGTWLEANPQFADRIIRLGHDLGNHTWSHPVLPDDDAVMTHEEVVRCRNLLVRLTGNGGQWFRPSGTPQATPLILRAAGRAGYPTSLSYDVDPFDYTNPGASLVTQRVLDEVRPGSIISLHTLYAGTAQALPAILHGLKQRGLRPVTARTLLGAQVAA
ncbi:MAG: polysaccharide deacetylase family protein [Frankiaceae bacterium]|nr:polysaccharide deacetylase family protein [Frankiaceae bacterium]MBV9872820.1 polysaccharide deacetylase family protein [Frankiaceae bacterium]